MGRKFTIQMDKLPGSRVKAWWYNPRTGDVTDAGEFENKGTHEFTCPAEGFGADWVLGLDDASKSFPKPQPVASRPAATRSLAPRSAVKPVPAK
jgi:hypothetical protein